MKSIALALALAIISPLGCGGTPPPRPIEHAVAEPHWQDVFDTLPELLVVVRAQAAREDRVFGPLLKRALELARAQSRVVGSTRALEAMSDAEELVVGLRPDTVDGPGELVLVTRGVRGDVDPGKLVDDDGRALWTAGPSGPVRELVRQTDEHGHPIEASLFELPGRTWVIAQGPARARAREAFAHPFGRPMLDLDPQALAVIRIDGPSLVARIHALQDLGGLASVGHHLRSVTFALPPGAEKAIRGTLAYSDEDSAAAAEVTARVAMETFSGKMPGFDWLRAATIDRPGKTLVVTAPLPTHLVEGLLHASSLPSLRSVPIDGDLPRE